MSSSTLCVCLCVQAHLYSICALAIDRCWLISWSRLGYVSRFLHSNDIPLCVCFPPVSYSLVQSRSACFASPQASSFSTSLPLKLEWWASEMKADRRQREREAPPYCVHLSFRKGRRKCSCLGARKTMSAVWWMYFTYECKLNHHWV